MSKALLLCAIVLGAFAAVAYCNDECTLKYSLKCDNGKQVLKFELSDDNVTVKPLGCSDSSVLLILSDPSSTSATFSAACSFKFEYDEGSCQVSSACPHVPSGSGSDSGSSSSTVPHVPSGSGSDSGSSSNAVPHVPSGSGSGSDSGSSSNTVVIVVGVVVGIVVVAVVIVAIVLIVSKCSGGNNDVFNDNSNDSNFSISADGAWRGRKRKAAA